MSGHASTPQLVLNNRLTCSDTFQFLDPPDHEHAPGKGFLAAGNPSSQRRRVVSAQCRINDMEPAEHAPASGKMFLSRFFLPMGTW